MYNAIYIIHKCVSYRAEYDSLRRFARYIFNLLLFFLSIILLLLITIFLYMSRVNLTRRDMMALFVLCDNTRKDALFLPSPLAILHICIYMYIYIEI